MKTDAVFKRAFNDAADVISSLRDGEPLPSENELGARLNVSRTTVRKILSTLEERGIVGGSGRQRFVRSAGVRLKHFPEFVVPRLRLSVAATRSQAEKAG